MSTEIKPGQIWKDQDGPGHVRIGTVTPTRVHYMWTDDSPAPGTHGSRYVDEFLSDFEPTTPAALDPSKVKAGDTVTVRATDYEMGTYEVSGTVVGALGGVLCVGPARIVQNGKWRTHYTLTDHQPAPNPEWKPGTTGTATIRGFEDVRVFRIDHSARGEWGWVAATAFPTDRFGVVFEDDEISDFVPDEPRPLPTREQVEHAVQGTVLALYPNPGPKRDEMIAEAVNAVLALLRGESR